MENLLFLGVPILKHIRVLFIDDGIDLYSSRCMSDPNFMALSLTVPEKQG